mmetsp:Transcript_51355/g.115316  ORF Transcript_51355/g.115316 Transcript_51355/m.115316 type:complete len:201 (-) Transcript_51355:192-794(-)
MKSMRISGARRANGCIKEGELPRREMLRNELDPDDHQHGDERRKNESGRRVELECPESGKAQHLHSSKPSDGHPAQNQLLLLPLQSRIEGFALQEYSLAAPQELITRHDLLTQIEEDAGDDSERHALQHWDEEGGGENGGMHTEPSHARLYDLFGELEDGAVGGRTLSVDGHRADVVEGLHRGRAHPRQPHQRRSSREEP